MDSAVRLETITAKHVKIDGQHAHTYLASPAAGRAMNQSRPNKRKKAANGARNGGRSKRVRDSKRDHHSHKNKQGGDSAEEERSGSERDSKGRGGSDEKGLPGM